MDGTIIQQGTFTQAATATNKYLQIRSDVDWIRVINLTQAAATNINTGYEFFWHRSMTAAAPGIVYYHPAADHTSAVAALTPTTGFHLVDTSAQVLVTGNAITNISNALPPVVLTGNTTGLANGDVVRMTNIIGAQQLSGMDFTIGGLVPNTSFTLANMSAIVTAAAPATSWRKVFYDPIFYPTERYVTAITQAASAVVSTSVDHGYVVGQVVGFRVPASHGMVQMNNLRGTITAITAGTFTVNIDTSAFTAFAFPVSGAQPFSHAMVVPVGDNDNLILTTATRNQSYIGMMLFTGLLAPAGTANDVSVWIAGKSFNT